MYWGRYCLWIEDALMSLAPHFNFCNSAVTTENLWTIGGSRAIAKVYPFCVDEASWDRMWIEVVQVINEHAAVWPTEKHMPPTNWPLIFHTSCNEASSTWVANLPHFECSCRCSTNDPGRLDAAKLQMLSSISVTSPQKWMTWWVVSHYSTST